MALPFHSSRGPSPTRLKVQINVEAVDLNSAKGRERRERQLVLVIIRSMAKRLIPILSPNRPRIASSSRRVSVICDSSRSDEFAF